MYFNALYIEAANIELFFDLKYKENPNVKLYAFNIPMKRDAFGFAKK
jgi:hypothetical protein